LKFNISKILLIYRINFIIENLRNVLYQHFYIILNKIDTIIKVS